MRKSPRKPARKSPRKSVRKSPRKSPRRPARKSPSRPVRKSLVPSLINIADMRGMRETYVSLENTNRYIMSIMNLLSAHPRNLESVVKNKMFSGVDSEMLDRARIQLERKTFGARGFDCEGYSDKVCAIGEFLAAEILEERVDPLTHPVYVKIHKNLSAA